MTQAERLAWLIQHLLVERGERADAEALPKDSDELWRLYRSLVNVRPPAPASAEYLAVEDAYLQKRLQERGVVQASDLAAQARGGIVLWQGDITRLAADAIVNAANSQMLGCFVPCHSCIDNAIHTAAGVRLRATCADLMCAQGSPEPTGQAKVTPGFNLPARFVIHTVGPIVQGFWPTARNRAELASCYQSCLEAAVEHGLSSIAFCCISTGEFRFPQREAARIAVNTVRRCRAEATAAGTPCGTPFPTVVFNVFKDSDLAIYQEILGQ